MVYIKSILSAFFALLAFTIISCQNETSSKDDDSVLSSITISTLPTKTTYEQNETFTPSGLKITASYSDKSTKTIAYPATRLSVTQPSTESTGTKTVTVSYTENAVTKSTTFTITVTPPASEKITTTEEIGGVVYYVKSDAPTTASVAKKSSTIKDGANNLSVSVAKEDDALKLGSVNASADDFKDELSVEVFSTTTTKHYYSDEYGKEEVSSLKSTTTTYSAKVSENVSSNFDEVTLNLGNGTFDLDKFYELYTDLKTNGVLLSEEQKSAIADAKPEEISDANKEKASELISAIKEEKNITNDVDVEYLTPEYNDNSSVSNLGVNYSNATINVNQSMFGTIGEDFNHYTTSKLDKFISESNIKSFENQTKTEELIPGIDIQYHLLYNINLPQKALKFNSNVKNVVFDLNNEEVKMSFLYKGGIVSDNLSLKNTANATLTGSLYTDQMNNDLFKAILNENFSTNNLPNITAYLNEETIKNLYGTRVDELLAKYYTSTNSSKISNFEITPYLQFDAKDALNGSSMFAENNNGGVSSNSNAYHLDVNAFMHMLNNFNEIGNVLIDGQNYFGNSLDKGKGYIANVVFGQDYHDIDISNLSPRGIIMSGENGRLPVIGSAPYARIVLFNNDTYVPGIHAVDFSNLSLAKAKELEPQARVETFFNPTHKNDISISPTHGSVIYYFGNNYKTNYEADKDTGIFKASISTYEEIGNELINSTGKDVDTLLMQDKASYFENATRIQ
ncbi:MAG: bacterial Ig-like domain-containing protein [Treponema sp.]|nr:bacterial Ig-like domain-containing protein [Treponema sp.]